MPQQLAPHLLSWAPDLDPNAEEQAIRSSELPFIHGHVALMPDAHWGMGATVGSVIPTKGAVIPAAVGVDIGCGMIAARLQYRSGAGLTSDSLPHNLDGLHVAITAFVPAGVGQGHQIVAALERHSDTAAWQRYGAELEQSAGRQLGSLGSGNHFVEICLDEADRGLGRAAFRFARCREQAGQGPHRHRQRPHEGLVHQPRRP